MIRSLRYILSQVRVAHLGIVATVLFVLCVVQCVRCSELAGGHDSPSNGSIRVLAHIADPDAPCPSPITAKGGTWNGKKVFEPAPNEKLPPSMRTLCAYDWTASRAGAPPDHSALSSLGVPVESEFPVLATLAPVTPVTPQQATDLAKATSAFLDQVGKGPWPAGLKQTTTLAFVDSSPRSLGQISLGKNPHGFNVGWIAQSIACPNTAAGAGAPWCASRPNMHLALRHPTPPTPNSTPDPDGGSYGTRSQLAAAIFEAVKDARSTSPRSGLIVNLSVGWEPQFDCVDAPRDAASTSNDEKKAATQKKGTSPIVEGPATHQTARPESGRFSPPPPRSHCRKGQISRDPLGLASVHEALLYAACHGAIVVAAAGNDMGYTPPLEGAMMPARWENSPRPTFDECDRWFGKKLEEGDAKATYRPLVYAVSGLTATNAMIPLSRTHARTRLFAPASLGVGFREGVDLSATTTNPWHLMTGTSVGAAVVSAVAATAWAYRDDLTGPEIMDLVYASGEKLETFTPELCLSPAPTGACDESRRISMCFAIKKVCGTTACQALTCTPSPQNVTALLAPPPVPTGDPGPVMSFPPELYNVVYGQPGTPVCPDCSLKVPGANNKPWELHGDPNSSLDVPTTFFTSNGVNQITGMTLKLYDARGALLQTFSSVVTGALISPPGYSYNGTVTPTDQIGGAGTNSPAAGDISSATLTWTQHFSLGGSSLVSHEIRIVAGP